MSKLKSFKYLFRNEDGSAAMLVAISLTVLLISASLVIDYGAAYVEASKLQNATDAAALAAAAYLPVNIDDYSKIDYIKDVAINYMKKNGFDNVVRDDVILESQYGNRYTGVKVVKSCKVDFTLAKIIGKVYQNVTKSSKVGLSLAQSVTGAAPLSIDKAYLDNAIETGQTKHLILKYGTPTDNSGNFGAIDLNGSTGGGANDYRYWLSYGYGGEIKVGETIPYEQGNMSGPTLDAFVYRYNACTHFEGLGGCTSEHFEKSCPRIVLVPVITELDSQHVRIEGFAAFVLEEVGGSGNQNYVLGSFVELVTKSNFGADFTATSNDYGVYIKSLQE
jgi:Flp pilus assembly protein TadG